METKKSFKQKFRNFKEGRMGRTVDITLGSLLLIYSILFEPYRIIALMIGILAFTAGVFNVCWAAPFIGIPFKGKSNKKNKSKNANG